jgi:hypothetical protein
MTNSAAPAYDASTLYRWCDLFGILSLDMTSSHFADMGLPVADVVSFQAGLRALIERARAAEQGTWQDVTSFVEGVFRWASERYGAEFAQALRAWGDDVARYDPSRGAQAFYWQNLILRGGLDGARDAGPPPPFVSQVRNEMRRRKPDLDVDEVPATVWDRAYFDRHGVGVAERGEVAGNPMDLVENTIYHYWFCRAWEAARARSADLAADMEDLWRWGQSEAPRLNMPVELLARPSEWPLLPPPVQG